MPLEGEDSKTGRRSPLKVNLTFFLISSLVSLGSELGKEAEWVKAITC